MNALSPPTPLPYSPTFEVPEAHETETHAELVDTLVGMARTMADHTGHALRGVHAKSHALLRGKLHVMGGLPEVLAQGLFATPGTYDVVARISTPPAEELDDNVSLPRGFVLKVLDVPGARVEGSEADSTQDFLMVDGPVFSAKDSAAFLKTLKLLAGTTDKVPRLKKALSTVLQGVEKVVEAVGGQSGTLIAMGGHRETHPLGATFFSQVPMLYGPYMAKLQLAPASAELLALKDQPIDIDGKPDGTREVASAFFNRSDAVAGEWDLRVQLCTDLETMPIEDASVEWPQEQSPFVTVARLVLPPQAGWSDALSKEIDDGMSFNPWHALAAHRPLGSVMRARRPTYAASARFRGQFNGCPIHEPKSGSGSIDGSAVATPASPYAAQGTDAAP